MRRGTRDVVFLGTSQQALRAFPKPVRTKIGHQLDLVQSGEEPTDWKPMTSIGPGVREIRPRDASGAFRVIYVAAMADAIYVLHAFQKKTEATAPRDLDLATKRLA